MEAAFAAASLEPFTYYLDNLKKLWREWFGSNKPAKPENYIRNLKERLLGYDGDFSDIQSLIKHGGRLGILEIEMQKGCRYFTMASLMLNTTRSMFLKLRSKTAQLCFGLRSASGESGAESGEKRLAESQPERNAAAEPQTEARRSCGTVRMPLVTSAHFAKRNGRGREGDRADRQPVKRSKGALVTAASDSKHFSPPRKPF